MSDVLMEATGLVKAYGGFAGGGWGVAERAAGGNAGVGGESGSGKSTVARMMLRLVEPTAGSVMFDGVDVLGAGKRELRGLRRRMGMVFQDPFAALNPKMRVGQIVAEPLAIQGGFGRAEVRARVAELLGEVGLDGDVVGRYPHAFSGGQRQRINIARALALRPEFLALDEPVSALDVSVGAQVVNLLKELQRKHGLTYLFISHSMPLVRYLCDRVAVMERGRLVEVGDAVEVCERRGRRIRRGWWRLRRRCRVARAGEGQRSLARKAGLLVELRADFLSVVY